MLRGVKRSFRERYPEDFFGQDARAYGNTPWALSFPETVDRGCPMGIPARPAQPFVLFWILN